MLPGLPLYIVAVFIATTLLTVWIFIQSSVNKKITAVIITAWLLLTGILASQGFYKDTSTVPPKLAFAVAPTLITIIILFSTQKGRRFIDSLSIKLLTLLCVVRIPVEFVLYWLYLNKVVPEIMTFAGRNFDIVAGITAPIIFVVCFKGNQVIRKKLLMVWNFVSLLLLLNIVITAIFSLPFPLQQFGFDQPNIAILYFPFVWLPCCIVPIVLLAHLALIRKLFFTRQ